jgi:hypothetical protein
VDPEHVILEWLKRHDQKDDANFAEFHTLIRSCQACQRKSDRKLNAILVAFAVLAVVNGGTSLWPAIVSAVKLWHG